MISDSDGDEILFQVELMPADVHLLKRAVDKYLETWPGGDHNEQIRLLACQTWLNRMMLESTFGRFTDDR